MQNKTDTERTKKKITSTTNKLIALYEHPHIQSHTFKLICIRR